MAIWVAFSWTLDAFDASPRLALISPVPECGKTTVLTLLIGLVPNPLPASNTTPAVIFRAIDAFGCTLIIDEADTFMDERDELAGILNCGHTRATGFVLRCVGNSHTPRRFSTWAPIVIARIGELPAALKTRSIVIDMQRAKPGEDVERITSTSKAILPHIHGELEQWAKEQTDMLRGADPEMPSGFRGRLADNWRPLLSIADLAGGEWPQRARDAAQKLSGDRELPSGIQLLAGIRHVFRDQKVDKLPSGELCDALSNFDDQRLWTPSGIARVLKQFRIRPRGIRIGSKTPKGYLLSDFEDAFGRYLDDEEEEDEEGE